MVVNSMKMDWDQIKYLLIQDRYGDVPASQSLIYALMLMQIIEPIRM
jgi:hypothetical protein